MLPLPVVPIVVTPVKPTVAPVAGLYAMVGATGVPAGQFSGHWRCTGAAVPRVSLQVSVAVWAVAALVQVSARFCGVVVLPTKLRLIAAAPAKLPGLAPPNVQVLIVVVAPAPVPSPPDGVATMLPLPVVPIVVTPVKPTVEPVVGS